MRFVGRGDGAIRATHAKTLELIPDPVITERATCVIAVGTQSPPRALAGPVAVTISCGGESFQLRARANSAWQPGGSAVIRRSDVRLPGTFATSADAAAADLPRTLVERLRDPSATVEVDVEPIAGVPCLVLAAVDPTLPVDAQLAAEIAAADHVIAEDVAAARLLGARVSRDAPQPSGRVLIAASHALPGSSVHWPADHVEVIGLPDALAAAAAAAGAGVGQDAARTPVLIAAPVSDLASTLRRAPAGVRLVVAVSAKEVGRVLRQAADVRGTTAAVLVRPYAPPQRVDVADPPALSGADAVQLCLLPSPPELHEHLDPVVRRAVDDLLADAVPTRTVARALATLADWDRRRAYDVVLNWPASE